MKERFHGSFGGQFKEGKDYGDVEYHLDQVKKMLVNFSFSVTIETTPIETKGGKKDAT
jgi:hypothetical protein